MLVGVSFWYGIRTWLEDWEVHDLGRLSDGHILHFVVNSLFKIRNNRP